MKNLNTTEQKLLKMPELLAPAGDFQAFLGAINAGADAVYLAGDRFGARAYATNLSRDEILEALLYAHVHSRKIYLTVNTLTKNLEGRDLFEYLEPLYLAGLDGVIVQDFGVFSYLHRVFPDLPLHVSTQMSVTSFLGAKAMRDLGASRIVPARELSLEEIRQINELGVETECFIHGSMCYSYSGQCLFSSFLGGRSGNRGRCAGPCRQPYIPEGENREAYLLSLKDLCTLQILPKLIDAGISSFKIEGRMKSPAYAAGVSAIYRKYIDLYCESKKRTDTALNFGSDTDTVSVSVMKGVSEPVTEYKVDQEDLKKLKFLYLRTDLQEGYYEKTKGREMVSIKSPSYNKTDDDLSAELTERYCRNKVPKKVGITAEFVIGKPAVLCTVSDKISVTGDIVQEAKKAPLIREDLSARLSKSSGGYYSFAVEELNLSEDAFVPVGAINALRRELEEKLTDVLKENYSIRRISEQEFGKYEGIKRELEKSIIPFRVFVTTVEQLQYLSGTLKKEDEICFPIDFLYRDKAKECISVLKKNPERRFYAVFPSVLRSPNLEPLDEAYHTAGEFSNICGFYVSQPDSYEFLIEKKIEAEIENSSGMDSESKVVPFGWEIRGDLSFYMTNNVSLTLFDGLGSYTVSTELSKEEIRRMNSTGMEIMVYGRIPLMQSANCVRNTTGKCRKTEGFTLLSDRMRADFPIFTHCREKVCYNTIYNSVPVSLHKHLDVISGFHPAGLQIRFTNESIKECDLVYHIFDQGRRGNLPDKVPYEFTNGHFVKGVL